MFVITEVISAQRRHVFRERGYISVENADMFENAMTEQNNLVFAVRKLETFLKTFLQKL